MDGFKPTVKMKCGGSVSKAVAKAKGGVVEKTTSDLKQDKKIVKKAINLHDDQLHEGAKTDLSTLKKGGRCKKTGGTVRKYATGGLIEAKGGKKPRPRPEPPGGVEPDDVPYAPAAPSAAMKKGGNVKKMADGIPFTPAPQMNMPNPLQTISGLEGLAQRQQAMEQQQIAMQAKMAIGKHMQGAIDPNTGRMDNYKFISNLSVDPSAQAAFGDAYHMLLENGEIEEIGRAHV